MENHLTYKKEAELLIKKTEGAIKYLRKIPVSIAQAAYWRSQRQSAEAEGVDLLRRLRKSRGIFPEHDTLDERLQRTAVLLALEKQSLKQGDDPETVLSGLIEETFAADAREMAKYASTLMEKRK